MTTVSCEEVHTRYHPENLLRQYQQSETNRIYTTTLSASVAHMHTQRETRWYADAAATYERTARTKKKACDCIRFASDSNSFTSAVQARTWIATHQVGS